MAYRRSKSSALAVQKGRRAPSDSEMDAAARAQGYTSLAAMQGAMARAEHDRLSQSREMSGGIAPLELGPRRLSTALTNTDAYLASLGKKKGKK